MSDYNREVHHDEHHVDIEYWKSQAQTAQSRLNGLVERVQRRVAILYPAEDVMVVDVIDALRAELGMEYPKPDGEQGDAASMEAGEVGG